MNKIRKREKLIKTGGGLLPFIKQLLFPLRCPVCDEIVKVGEGKICPQCRQRLKPVTEPWCMRCGKKLQQEGEYCQDCRSRLHSFVRGRALFEYESAAPAIYRLKYSGRQEYADFFGEEISRQLGSFIRRIEPEGLVPIPLHKSRLRRRGYNQAELLAKAVGKYTGVPVYGDLLKRVKNTAPLKTQNREERQNNLKKAFNIARNDVKLKTIIIIDDIYTTGSTIDEAAQVLRQQGAEKIYFITLACGAGI